MIAHDQRWEAVLQRDRSADGAFYTCVKTTGIYCRPSCPARHPRRENVEFQPTWEAAEAAGFRACKRCKPREAGSAALVERACRLLDEQAMDLAALAAAVGLSPSHFHRLFKSIVGVTPKAYASAGRARRVREALAQGQSVTGALYEAGFNSNAGFYARSDQMLGMRPSTYREGGPGVVVHFTLGTCSLGSVLVAASERGLCALTLGDDPERLLIDLQQRFPQAELVAADPTFQEWVAQVVAFVERPSRGLNLPLDVQGTAFQQRVWQALRAIPCGETRSYAELAASLGQPRACRAVASACAANPLAVVIPCHRVVRSDGSLSGYRWGVERKARLLESERG